MSKEADLKRILNDPLRTYDGKLDTRYNYLEDRQCGPGWDSLILPLVEMCEAKGIKIAQIKEKFGGLRFYVDQYDEELGDAIRVAEDMSFSTCEECGEPGTRTLTNWVKVYCPKHAHEYYTEVYGEGYNLNAG